MKENYAPRWQELLVLPSGPMSDSDFLSFSLLSDDFSTSGQGFRAWNPPPLPHLLPRWWLRSHVRPSHVNHVCVSLALSVYLEARSVPFGKQSLVTIFKSPCMCALLVKKGEKVFLEFPGKAKKNIFYNIPRGHLHGSSFQSLSWDQPLSTPSMFLWQGFLKRFLVYLLVWRVKVLTPLRMGWLTQNPTSSVTGSQVRDFPGFFSERSHPFCFSASTI